MQPHFPPPTQLAGRTVSVRFPFLLSVPVYSFLPPPCSFSELSIMQAQVLVVQVAPQGACYLILVTLRGTWQITAHTPLSSNLVRKMHLRWKRGEWIWRDHRAKLEERSSSWDLGSLTMKSSNTQVVLKWHNNRLELRTKAAVWFKRYIHTRHVICY